MVHLSTAELNILDGVTSKKDQVPLVQDGVTAQLMLI